MNRGSSTLFRFYCCIVFSLFSCGQEEEKKVGFVPVLEIPEFNEVVAEKFSITPSSFLNTTENSKVKIIHSLGNTAFHVYNAAAFDTENNGVLVGGTQLRIRTTKDGGENWEERKFSGFSNSFHSAAFYKKEAFVVGESNYIFKSDASLSDWFALDTQKLTGIKGDNRKFYKIKFIDNVGYCIGEDSKIGNVKPCVLKTVNGGKSWKTIALKGLDNDEIAFSDIAITSKDILYTVTFNGNAYKSEDGGISWKKVFKSLEPYSSFNSIDFKNEEIGFIGGLKGKLFMTSDAGHTWKPSEFMKDSTELNIADIKVIGDELVGITTARSFLDEERPLFSYLLNADTGAYIKPLLSKKDSTVFFKGDSYHLYPFNDTIIYLTDRNNLYKVNLKK